MDFRYRLAKKTFKNKKIPKKRATGMDVISHDQRGDDSSPEISPLSLDKQTITPKPKPQEEEKEVSRRDLFSFGGFMKSAAELDVKPIEETEEEELPDSLEIDETLDKPITDLKTDGSLVEKKGFFKRLISRFRPDPGSDIKKFSSTNPIKSELTNSKNEDLSSTVLSEESNKTKKINNETLEEVAGLKVLEEEEDVDPEYDRRGLIKQGMHFFAKPAVQSVQSKVDKVNEAVDKFTKRVPLLRPPGAITERQFLQDCTRCDKCIHACPKDAIVKAPKKFGFLVMGTPYIDPIKNPCVMCDDLPCISACPDGALLPVDSPADVNMGYAILDKKKCQAYGDTFCQQCIIDCPIPGAITQNKDQQPIFHKNICTGCGVCVRSCSTVNIPVALKIKPLMVIEQQIRKKQMEEEQIRYEAEKKILEQKAVEDELLAQSIATKTSESDTESP
jgi:MauM/NapG family ferredoxin protein